MESERSTKQIWILHSKSCYLFEPLCNFTKQPFHKYLESFLFWWAGKPLVHCWWVEYCMTKIIYCLPLLLKHCVATCSATCSIKALSSLGNHIGWPFRKYNSNSCCASFHRCLVEEAPAGVWAELALGTAGTAGTVGLVGLVGLVGIAETMEVVEAVETATGRCWPWDGLHTGFCVSGFAWKTTCDKISQIKSGCIHELLQRAALTWLHQGKPMHVQLKCSHSHSYWLMFLPVEGEWEEDWTRGQWAPKWEMAIAGGVLIQGTL